jgi:sulfotransferase
MEQKIFYQSSMPRAGSTLLQNIIGQNPNFYVTPTSGMVDLVLGAKIGYNQSEEAKSGDVEMWKKGMYSFCREGLKGYVSTITDKPYILDKSRAWGAQYSLLNNINPNPKIIVLVRDLRAIFASMEKKFRANPDKDDGTVNNRDLTGITTQQRVEMWGMSHPIGYALLKLNQSVLDKTANNFLFLRYEDLCENPKLVIKSVYDYFELPQYEHNYDHIEQVTVEDDTIHGIYGDHIIRNKILALPDDSKDILGEYTYQWIYENFKWYFETFRYNK